MKILLVGGGAREHSIACALKKDVDIKLYSVMKNRNPGIMRLSESYENFDETDVEATSSFASRIGIDFAIVGPESPLAAGTADALEKSDMPCVGPKRALARIESDKEFMRSLMDKYNIPCSLKYGAFDDVEEALEYIDTVGEEVAIKPVGLTGGKGVKVVGEQLEDLEDAKGYIRQIIDDGIGGGKVVIEEKALGEEFTLQAFVDGSSIAVMPAVQDHKRAYEGDKGHNTGGMGSYSDSDFTLPFVDKATLEKAGEVIKKTVKALKVETGEGYKGILYGQFMLGKNLKLIEFNCRFGDPEAMNVLSIIKSSLPRVCEEIIDGSLGKVDFENKATVCKYVVPEGYGLKSVSGQRLMVDEKGIKDLGAAVYFAAVNEEDGKIYTTSSRSVGVVGIAESIKEAERICEDAISLVSASHVYHRRDIGTLELIEEKLLRMKEIR